MGFQLAKLYEIERRKQELYPGVRGSGKRWFGRRFHRRESEKLKKNARVRHQVKPHQVEIPEPEKEEPERILYAHAPVAVENIIPEPKVQVQESLNETEEELPVRKKKKPERPSDSEKRRKEDLPVQGRGRCQSLRQ